MSLASIVSIDRVPWRHPWASRARWSADKLRWEAMVHPGLVNALDPVVRLQREDWPLGFEPPTPDAAVADVALVDLPRIPLAGFRSPDPIPDFFVARGVMPASEMDAGGDFLEIQQLGLLSDAANARQLRACDLVLVMDKPVMTTEWTLGATLDGSTAQFSIGITQAPNHSNRARVVSKTQHVPPQPPSRIDLLTGVVGEQAQDEVLIATIYLLSPPGAALDASPDDTWQAFTQHHLFWNLHHGMKQLEPPLAKQNLSLNTGLAGGIGDAWNNFVLSQINDAASAASEFLGREMLETRVWTA